MAKELDLGSIRIKSKELKLFEKKDEDLWKAISELDEDILTIIELYKDNNNFELLLDAHDENFLRGSVSPDPEKKVCGARVMVLPNGEKLARAGFSLFAKDLMFNFDNDECLWDVCYTNASKSKTYLYTESKVQLEQDKKLRLVEKFEKHYLEILENCEEKIKQRNCETVYLALYVMLKTFIRVGNIEYYKRFNHKGLTTLQIKDISIDNNFITFEFIGKDGVPQKITKRFEDFFIKKFKKLIGNRDKEEFLFVNENNNVLHSDYFSKILFQWTEEHFYPHIIRSHFADMTCKEFLKKHRTATKQQVEQVFLEIAENLGHKKYNKKTDTWEICFNVTLKNYIHPSYSDRMIKLYSNE